MPTELPTKLPTVSIYGSSGQTNLHGNSHGQPTGNPLCYPRAAHGQRSGQLPCFFRMGMASILNLIVGSSLGCPMNFQLFPYYEVVGCPLSRPMSCRLYRYMEVVGNLICMEKFPWAAHPLSSELPTVSIYGSSGSLICMAKFPWAATPLTTCSQSAAKWAAPLFIRPTCRDVLWYGAGVCPSVCLSTKLVNTIQTEPFKLGPSNLVNLLLMTRGRNLLIFKVSGQRSRSHVTHCC